MRALIQKEYRELIRDRRSLLATFAYALIGPVILYVLLQSIIASVTDDIQVNVAIVGEGDKAQQVSQFLRHHDIGVSPFDGDAPANFDSQKWDAVLVIGQKQNAAGFYRDSLNLYTRNDTDAASRKKDYVEQQLQRFISIQQSNQILASGVNAFDRKWQLNVHQVNAHSAKGKRLLDSLLIFILLSPFIITLNYINDATAGERERGSLMPLLTQPVARTHIVMAKWIIGVLLGFIGCAITMALGFKLMGMLPLYHLNMQLNITPVVFVQALIVVLPLAFVVAAGQMWLAMTAKSFKEGQSYLTMFSMLPMMAVFMVPADSHAQFAHVPLIGHQNMLQSIFSNQLLDWGQWLSLTAVCVGLSIAMLVAVKHQFDSERLMAG